MLLVQSQVINISILQSKCRLVLHPLPNISILQSISQLTLHPLSVTIFPASIPTFKWCSHNECKVVNQAKVSGNLRFQRIVSPRREQERGDSRGKTSELLYIGGAPDN